MKAQAGLQEIAPGRWRVTGALDVVAVSALAAEGERLIRAASKGGIQRLSVDLSAVESANSAALALLVEWLEQACRRGLELVYIQPPQPLMRLARLSNLDGLLPLATHLEGGTAFPGTGREST